MNQVKVIKATDPDTLVLKFNKTCADLEINQVLIENGVLYVFHNVRKPIQEPWRKSPAETLIDEREA